MTKQDVAQETEKWADWAALASAGDSAHSSVSCVTSSLVTQYSRDILGLFHNMYRHERDSLFPGYAAESCDLFLTFVVAQLLC